MTSTVITLGDIEITGTGIFKGDGSGLTNIPYSGDNATFNRLTVNSNTNLGSYAPTNIAVITLAGSGAAAFLDGTMEGASFNKPHGVAVSPDGIIYIADASNNRIRKVTPGGVVTTLASSLNSPRGVAVGPDGNIYVAETDGNRIRKVTPGGVLTTLAGSGTAGSTDGIGTSASFNSPRGVAVDRNGDIYVADCNNNRIRKVTPGGVVTTLAGSGTAGSANGIGGAASFNSPKGISIGPDRTIYVADSSNNLIRKITRAGDVTTFVGIGGTEFNDPQGISVDSSGNVFVADTVNNLIRKVSPGGVITTLAGSGNDVWADGIGTAASFNRPSGLAFGPDGSIYVADTNTHSIRKIHSGLSSLNMTGNTYVSNYITSGGNVNVNGNLDVSGNTNLRGGVNAYGIFDVSGVVNIYGPLYVPRVEASSILISTVIAPQLFISSIMTSTLTAPQLFISSILTSTVTAPQLFISSIMTSTLTAPQLFISSIMTSTVITRGDIEIRGTGIFKGDGSGLTNIPYSGENATFSILTVNSNINLGGLPGANNVVTTLVGSGSAGSTNNVNGLYASFNTPLGVAVASDGTIYVADYTTHLIRKVTPGGVVTTLAGSSAGGIDGTGTGAQFNGPSGLAIGPDGNIYVAEYSGHRIRKVTPNGVVTTLAGNGAAEFADGTGSAARFSYPYDLAIGPDGTIYVADYGNNRIRIVTLTGVVRTLAGDGTTTVLNFPIGVAVGPDGNIYTTEYFGHRVSRLNTGGQITRLAGSTDNSAGYVDATGTVARFDGPQGIVVDRDGSIYVTDRNNDRIRKLIFNGTAWVVTTLAGNATAGFADGTGTAASFYEPVGIAIGPDGTIYIGDSQNHRIRKIDSGLSSLNMTGNAYFTNFITAGGNVNVNGDLDVSGNTNLRGVANVYGSLTIQANPNRNLSGVRGPINVVTTLAGSGSYAFADGTGADATFKNPSAVAVDTDGSIYIADASNNRIRKVTPGGVVTTFAGTGAAGFINDGTTSATLTAPEGLAIDTDVIYVADTGNNRIRIVNKTTRVVTTLAGGGIVGGGFLNAVGTNAILDRPRGIIIHPNGFIYFADSSNNRIRRIRISDGNVETVAGNTSEGSLNAVGTSATFNNPHGIACDIDGNIYVADKNNHMIRKITISNSNVETIAGSDTQGFADGTGTGASFNNPTGIFVDSSRNIYVADAGNHRIRKMIYNGTAWVVTTLAGNAAAGFADGTGVAASFNSPRGVAVGPDGTIYVADASNHRLCKIDSADLTLVNIKGNLDVSGNTNLIGGVKSYKTSIFSPDLFITSPDSVNNKILRFTVDAGATWIQSGSDLVGGSTSPLYFSGMYGGNIRMAIDGGGNVGIGTTSPACSLHVNNTYNAANTIPILGTGVGQTITPGIKVGILNIGAYYAANNIPVIWSEDGLIIQASNGGVSIPRNNLSVGENITASGNVGIGVTTPTNRLSIASDVPYANLTSATLLRTTAQLHIKQTTGTGSLYIANGYTGGVGTGSVIQTSDYYSSADHGTTLFLNPYGGNVNFGDAVNFKTDLWQTSGSNNNPRFWFVNNGETHFGSGNGRFTFRRADQLVDNLVLENNGNLTALGDVTAYSDVRSKTNIVEIDSPLEKIMKMRGVYYNRIDDSNAIPDRHLGVIAQEIERVLPEVVLTDTSEAKNKSVAYGNIVAILIEGMKAQESTIKGIQAILSSRT
jgi:sugar lactone lactonase YvrE